MSRTQRTFRLASLSSNSRSLAAASMGFASPKGLACTDVEPRSEKATKLHGWGQAAGSRGYSESDH